MAALTATNPTLLDITKSLDPNGNVAQIVEVLNQSNEILDDMTWQEGNLATGHLSAIRSGIPAPTWRKLYGGVQPAKATVVQVTDSCGMLQAYAEVDCKAVNLARDPQAYRLQQDMAFLEGMNQEVADTLFYGNESTEPEAFTGLAPRFNSTTAENGQQIILGGSADTDNQSIWLVGWSPRTVFGIFPRNSQAGFQSKDLGEVTVENVDGSNGRAQMYRTHYMWDCGIVVQDWRYIVRIANIELSALSGSGSNLIDLMTQAVERIHSLSGVRPAFYCSRTIRSFLRRQVVNFVKGSTLTMEQIAGKPALTFDGIPIRRVDRLASNESLVS